MPKEYVYLIEIEDAGLVLKIREYGRADVCCQVVKKIVSIKTSHENMLEISKIKGIIKIEEEEEGFLLYPDND